MRSIAFAVVLASCVLAAPAWGAEPASSVSPTQPTVAAAAWYVVGEDGAVVAAHDARVPRPMASITKLMTAIVTLERVRLDDVVSVDPRAASIGESTAFLRAGERFSVADLLRGTLVHSANDAAEALALSVGKGSESRFVAMMNAKAKALGLTDTHYVNPYGLDARGHVSSARDSTLLIRYALGIPFVRETLRQEQVALPGDGVFPTTDDLLASWPPLIGGKTGHTALAGWSETAGARKNGITVYGTVLGSPGRGARNDALETLLQYGLDRYRRVVAVAPGRVYAKAATGFGRPDVLLVAREGAVRTIPERTPLVERVIAPTTVALPVRAQQPLGSVEVYAGERLVASMPLVAAAAVYEPGLGGKLVWYTKRTAHHLWGLVT
jgi:serine-type D-Ala-D-Ala carboxypeptidase (penicillin-binding protein 5/6)